MDVRRLERDLKRHEGFRPDPYFDSEGIATFGYGFTSITEEEADILLANRVRVAWRDARTVVRTFDLLDDVRQEVLVNMSYNLGLSRLSGFKKTISAVNNGEYETAASEMLDSRWAVQVGARAEELSERMRTGEI